MKVEKLTELFKKYNLTKDDYFQHKHYKIITRQGIDKIQAIENIFISYDAVKVEPDFCVVKAIADKGKARIQTFGSAKYGGKTWDAAKNKWDEKGNTTTWYVMEMAEKRAMSRAVLKLTGFYELGVFGEDESEDFNKKVVKDNSVEQIKEINKLLDSKDVSEHIQKRVATVLDKKQVSSYSKVITTLQGLKNL